MASKQKQHLKRTHVRYTIPETPKSSHTYKKHNRVHKPNHRAADHVQIRTRLWANAIDFGLLFCVVAFWAIIMSIFVRGKEPLQWTIYPWIVGLISYLSYVNVKRKGLSVGRKRAGIIITTREGTACSNYTYWVRSFWNLLFMFSALFWIDWAVGGLSKKHQCLHDRWAKTVLTEAQPVPWERWENFKATVFPRFYTARTND